MVYEYGLRLCYNFEYIYCPISIKIRKKAFSELSRVWITVKK